MRRSTAVTALAAIAVTLLPAVPAQACSVPLPLLWTDRQTLVAGGTVRIAGDDVSGPPSCQPPVPVPRPSEEPSEEPSESASPTTEPDPSESPSPEPSESPSPEPVESPSPESVESPSPSPSETAVPLVPMAAVAAVRPAPAPPVTVTLAPHDPDAVWTDPPPGERVIAEVPANPPRRQGAYWVYSVEAVVRIPAHVRPGSYRLSAGQQGVAYFGAAIVEVRAALPQTGVPAGHLAMVGLLLLVAGGGALELARGRARG